MKTPVTLKSPPRRGTKSVKWDLTHHDDILAMWVADMDFACDPHITQALLQRVGHGIFGYTFAGEDFFEAFRVWAGRTQQWTIESDHQIFAPGMMPTIRELILGLSSPGQGVIIQPPVYNPFFSVVENAGRRLVKNPLILENCQYAINFPNLESHCSDPETKLMILCSPHNPVGRVWNETELRQIAEICYKNEVILIVDEIHGDLIHPGQSFYASGRLDMANVISIQSPGKTFNIPSLNTAQVIVSDSALRKKVKAAFDAAGFEIVNSLAQTAAIAGYSQGEDWLKEVLRQVEHNMILFDRLLLDAQLPMQRLKSQGTYLAWVDVSKIQNQLGIDTRTLQKSLKDEVKLWVSPGSQFGTPEGEGFLRFNLGCPEANIHDAVDRLRRWWVNRAD